MILHHRETTSSVMIELCGEEGVTQKLLLHGPPNGGGG
jgi:hypothetical protein